MYVCLFALIVRFLFVSLLQVAHFYNTIDQQMIPSQQPMLLDAALHFEAIIKQPKADADKVPTYSVHISGILGV